MNSIRQTTGGAKLNTTHTETTKIRRETEPEVKLQTYKPGKDKNLLPVTNRLQSTELFFRGNEGK